MERETVLHILNSVEKNKAFSNIAVNETIKKAGDVDSAFVRRMVYGVLENRIYLDYFISKFINSNIEQVKTNTLNILRMALYQMLYMDSVPDYAAVNEAVDLARNTSKFQHSFVNGVLRSILRANKKVSLPDAKKKPIKRLSVQYSVPEWMIKYLVDGYGRVVTEKFLQTMNQVPPLCIRVNTLKTDRDSLIEKLREAGFEAEPGKNSRNSVIVKGSGLIDTEMFEQGLFSVQDESSMIAIETLSPQPGDTVLDLCAAPGGKSLYTGELMQNQGKIISCDYYQNKLAIVERNAAKYGVENIECRVMNSAVFNKDMENMADKVICDVPCSGLGVIRRKPEIKYTRTFNDIKEMCKVQYAILKCGAAYVKPGGKLMYSTCTISGLENEGVISHFMKKNPGRFVIETKRQLTPFEDGTDGFFICVMKRVR